MKISHIIDYFNEKFPLSLQESYDNSGEQIIFYNNEVSSILFALDLDDTIIFEAIEKKSNLIITHHPFIFKGIKSLNSTDSKSALILKLIENKISLFSIHTNLDKIYFDYLAKKLDLTDNTLLLQSGYNADKEAVGFGTLSILDKSIPFSNMLERVKNLLNLDFLTYSGNEDAAIKKIAVVNGAGGKSIEKIIKLNNPDLIITGDIGYHDFKYAEIYSVNLIDAGHYGTEKILIEYLYEDVFKYLYENNSSQIKLYQTKNEKNPIKVYK